MSILSHMECRPRGAFAPFPAVPLRLFLDYPTTSATLVPGSSLPCHSASDVTGWFSGSSVAPWMPDREVLEGLLRKDTTTVHPILNTLPRALPIHIVRREREGARRYAFFYPGYAGPPVLTERQFQSLPSQPRLLLPSIPRRFREAFIAPQGQRYIVADVDRCFSSLLATVAQDDVLRDALRRDVHQKAGDIMAPHLPRTLRRNLGKRFNSAIIGLVSPIGWHRILHELGIHGTLEEALRMHEAWWNAHRAARDLRDEWCRFHRYAAGRGLPLRLIYPDGRRTTFDVATVRGMAKRPRWVGLRGRSLRLDASIRMTFSAIWRGIEGVLLDQVLAGIQPLTEHGLRLVLPTYDGLVLQAPAYCSHKMAIKVENVFSAALHQLGLTASVKVEVHRTWGVRATNVHDILGRCAV